MRRYRKFGVVALLIAGLLAVSGCARPIPPKQSLEELMEMGVPESYSRLDAAGIEAVRESQVMRVDLRDLKMYKADFGLPSARLSSQYIGGPDWPDVMLVVDGPSGQLVTSTRTFNFQNKDDESFVGLLFFLQFESVEELRAELLDPKWGLNREAFDITLGSLAMGKSLSSRVVGPGYTQGAVKVG